MDKLEFKGETYNVKFRHDRNYVGNGYKESKLPRGGKTIAFIRIGETEFIIAESVCSVKDNFNKELGRTIALGRLKKQLNEKASVV